ncbi:MAG: protein translocase subunit SecF [Vicinamibacterales bacterium]
MQIFTKPNFNFIRWRWHAIALSVVVIGAGLAYMVSQGGMPLGIDFKGGSIIILKFDRAVGEDAVRTALVGMPGEKVVQQYGPASAHEILVRLPQSVHREEDAPLDENVRTAIAALQQANLGTFEASTEVVGPVIGAQLQRKGLLATAFSILGITIYIAFRFRFSFALGAIVATFHDILVTLVFLALFGYDLSLNVVAALLTITGYSVNDTIVIFDRVRENFRSMRRDSLEHVVNTSVNQTLGRTIITAGTTLLSVTALYFFGGEVLEAFAFTMIVGIISGTYSTVFIAAAIAIILSRQREQARVPASTAAEAPGGGARKPNNRKNRASQA